MFESIKNIFGDKPEDPGKIIGIEHNESYKPLSGVEANAQEELNKFRNEELKKQIASLGGVFEGSILTAPIKEDNSEIIRLASELGYKLWKEDKNESYIVFEKE